MMLGFTKALALVVVCLAVDTYIVEAEIQYVLYKDRYFYVIDDGFQLCEKVVKFAKKTNNYELSPDFEKLKPICANCCENEVKTKYYSLGTGYCECLNSQADVDRKNREKREKKKKTLTQEQERAKKFKADRNSELRRLDLGGRDIYLKDEEAFLREMEARSKQAPTYPVQQEAGDSRGKKKRIPKNSQPASDHSQGLNQGPQFGGSWNYDSSNYHNPPASNVFDQSGQGFHSNMPPPSYSYPQQHYGHSQGHGSSEAAQGSQSSVPYVETPQFNFPENFDYDAVPSPIGQNQYAYDPRHYENDPNQMAHSQYYPETPQFNFPDNFDHDAVPSPIRSNPPADPAPDSPTFSEFAQQLDDLPGHPRYPPSPPDGHGGSSWWNG